jgi:hypothetical protein
MSKWHRIFSMVIGGIAITLSIAVSAHPIMGLIFLEILVAISLFAIGIESIVCSVVECYIRQYKRVQTVPGTNHEKPRQSDDTITKQISK